MNIGEFRTEEMPRENCVIVTIGASGSGKSTLAGELATSDSQIISSDDLREDLTGDATCQEENGLVFYMMGKIITCRGKHGAFTIADATHLKRKFRRQVANQYREERPKNKVIGILVDADEETCIARQNNRARKVPEHAVKRHCNQFEHSKQNVREEGFFDAVYIYDGQNVELYE